MAQIHIGRGTTNLGAFTEEEVRQGLESGRFLLTDLGWTDGMDNWKPLSEFPDLTAKPGTPALPITEGEPVLNPGLPWEDRDKLGFFNAFIETMKLVLLDPSKAFLLMKRVGGLSEPLIFAIVGGWIGGAAALVYNFLYTSLTHQNILNSPGIKDLPPQMVSLLSALQMTPARLAGGLIFLPVLLALRLFVVAGLTHLSLMLISGSKHSFETTFRVVCFGAGSTALFQLVPLCGVYIHVIWLTVLLCIGMMKAHEISTGKAVTAVFLPFFTCCCGLSMLIAAGGEAALKMLR